MKSSSNSAVGDNLAAGRPSALPPLSPTSVPCANAAGSRHANPRILAVWTRDLDTTERFGRVNVARQVRVAMREIGQVTNRRLTNAFEGASSTGSLLSAVVALLGNLLRGSL